MRKCSRHKPEKIVAKLAKARELIDGGISASMAAKENGVSEATYYRCVKEYGTMSGKEASEPWHNGYVEFLHNRMRDELFEEHVFDGIEHARHEVERWSKRYNTYHPHSALTYQSPDAYAAAWEAENNNNPDTSYKQVS